MCYPSQVDVAVKRVMEHAALWLSMKGNFNR